MRLHTADLMPVFAEGKEPPPLIPLKGGGCHPDGNAA